jgi:hypothetical protein
VARTRPKRTPKKKAGSFELQPRGIGGYTGSPAKVSRQPNQMTVSLDWEALPRAQYRFAANCARVYVRDGYPELQLGQLHPLHASELTKVLAVRYEPGRFKDRAENTAPFRADLEEFLKLRKARGEPGAYVAMMEAAASNDCDAAIIDAEVEWFFRLGDYAYGVFVQSYSRDMFRVVQGTSDQLPMHPAVEVSMPLRVLADLMMSWETAAREMMETTDA